jgi:hypothetical protein
MPKEVARGLVTLIIKDSAATASIVTHQARASRRGSAGGVPGSAGTLGGPSSVRLPSACSSFDAIENLAEIAVRDLKVKVVLQIAPKLCRCAKCLGAPKRSIGSNAGLFVRDPLNPRARQAASLGKSAGAGS